jgi:NAD(P)H-hydrate epimerase
MEVYSMAGLPAPALTTDQMREVDRLMIEGYGIELLQMMENAGRNLALLARRMLDDYVLDRPVVILAGRGNNGGGGLAAARHLHNWGAWVQVLCSYAPEEYKGAPAHQLSILQQMDVPLAWADEGWELPACDLVIDAVIGYGLRGDPRGKARDLILLANSSAAPVLSLDAPSGLDTAEGRLFDPHVQAAATMTLALPKRGLLVEPGRSVCGDLYLADISVPPELYTRIGLEVGPLFAMDTVVTLSAEDGKATVAHGHGDDRQGAG